MCSKCYNVLKYKRDPFPKFLTFKRWKIHMHYNRINHLMVLHIYQEKTSKVEKQPSRDAVIKRSISTSLGANLFYWWDLSWLLNDSFIILKLYLFSTFPKFSIKKLVGKIQFIGSSKNTPHIKLRGRYFLWLWL